MKGRHPISQARLKQILHYDPESGVFTYLVKTSIRVRAGQVAGTRNNRSGYVTISIDYRRYYGHRLAWLYMTGEWPTEQVDHRNTIRSDNRWTNLRKATNQFNNENRRRAHRDSATGVLGVARHGNKFKARIFVEGKERHLGMFETKEAAHSAYVAAKRVLHKGCTL